MLMKNDTADEEMLSVFRVIKFLERKTKKLDEFKDSKYAAEFSSIIKNNLSIILFNMRVSTNTNSFIQNEIKNIQL